MITRGTWPQELAAREAAWGEPCDPVGIKEAEVLSEELSRRRLAAGIAACNETTLPKPGMFLRATDIVLGWAPMMRVALGLWIIIAAIWLVIRWLS